jgi:hypothetical protein
MVGSLPFGLDGEERRGFLDSTNASTRWWGVLSPQLGVFYMDGMIVTMISGRRGGPSSRRFVGISSTSFGEALSRELLDSSFLLQSNGSLQICRWSHSLGGEDQ